MNHLLRLALALWATLAVGSTRSSATSVVPPSSIAQDDRYDDTDTLQDSQTDKDDLSALKIFNRVILMVKDNYVDPKRCHPKEMLLAALDYVQRTVADVIIDSDPTHSHLTVTVGTASKDFDISGVDSLWMISLKLRDIFSFMQGHLEKSDKPRDIEQAAVAGMLSTLDPHSVFLPPEAFKEMKLQTKGEFGGLGFIISMRDSQLTVVKVLKGTPAYQAGIKGKDKVTKIEEQSTVNMDLNDAVSKLRGKPGTKINITVVRKTWPAARRLTLTREIISIESVESRLLDAGLLPGSQTRRFVAGIKIKSFQGNTSHDLMRAMAELRQQAKDKGGQLSGVVLDLRDNPGGLLDQAIQVTNAFVDHGVIVTTVGYSDKMREVKRAHSGSDIETELPVAVLVDNGSASASEIVSGALKNLDRAIIVGRPTFGKGSVQVLYDFVDDTALKLTIAQYLTPGDISIQETGIIPDIELDPAYVTKDHIDAFSPKKQMGEADLEHHFGNPADLKPVAKRSEVVEKDKPSEIVRYFKETPKPKPGETDADAQENLEEADEDVDDDFKPDFQVNFARDLVVAAPRNTRTGMLEAAHGFVEQVREAEQAKINSAIAALGVDWSAGETDGAPRAVVEVKQSPPRAEAGQTLSLAVTVSNAGTGTLHQLRAYTLSDNYLFDRREFVFGAIGPGEHKSWTVPVKLPKDTPTQRDEVKLVFGEEHGQVPLDQSTEVQVLTLPRPAFAFSYSVTSHHTPEDGMPHVGDAFELKVDVTNQGAGAAVSSLAILKNLGDEKIFLKKGRDKLGVLKPGETKTATFEVALLKGYHGDTVPLRLQIVDDQLDEFVGEKLNLPVAPETLVSKAKAGTVRVQQSGPLVLTRPSQGSPAIAEVKKGLLLAEVGKVDGFYAVEWKPGRIGFLPEALGLEAKGKPGAATELMEFEPPKITVAGVDGTASAPVADGDHYPLSVSVTGRRPVRDVYVFVNEQKVFFHAAGKGEDPIVFERSLPLKPGNNTVLIVAREDDDYAAKRSFVVLRRGGDDEVAKRTAHEANPQ
jgi:carboxyl-terminal processing protease